MVVHDRLLPREGNRACMSFHGYRARIRVVMYRILKYSILIPDTFFIFVFTPDTLEFSVILFYSDTLYSKVFLFDLNT